MLRLLLLLLLLCRGLAVMLLVNHARGSRVLQMGGDRTLLLVVGVMRICSSAAREAGAKGSISTPTRWLREEKGYCGEGGVMEV